MKNGAVLISGAAGGIGQATVDRFLASGYEVAGLDLSPSVESLRPEPYRGKAADVTDHERLPGEVSEVLEGLQLRHVVSLAGRVVEEERGPVDREYAVALEGFSRSVTLNLVGQFAVVQASLPGLLASDGDRSITLCSSVNALRGFGAPAYSAAKAGLIGMMHALATPLGRRGVRINVVAPGTTRTPLLEEEIRRSGDPGILERKANEIPMGRVGMPADVAAVIEALADRLTYVNDEVIRVDGGQLLAEPFDPTLNRRLARWGRGVRRRLHNRPLR
jgi:NAD(P)-dependent dehydrogenase (short-subunit alcohol dehydrogenase family)